MILLWRMSLNYVDSVDRNRQLFLDDACQPTWNRNTLSFVAYFLLKTRLFVTRKYMYMHLHLWSKIKISCVGTQLCSLPVRGRAVLPKPPEGTVAHRTNSDYFWGKPIFIHIDISFLLNLCDPVISPHVHISVSYIVMESGILMVWKWAFIPNSIFI